MSGMMANNKRGSLGKASTDDTCLRILYIVLFCCLEENISGPELLRLYFQVCKLD